MRIQLNGEDREVASGSTISSLLEDLGQHPRTVAVEYNGEIVKRQFFPSTVLSEGDRLELVRFVQGGGEALPEHFPGLRVLEIGASERL